MEVDEMNVMTEEDRDDLDTNEFKCGFMDENAYYGGFVDLSKMSQNFRKRFKIPKKLSKVYIVSTSSFNKVLSNFPEARKHLECFDYYDGELIEEGFSGVFRTKDFTVVSALIWSGKTDLIHFIYTNDPNKVKSFFKKEFVVKKGVYEVHHDALGETTLYPIKVENVLVPVLNDNLFEELKKEIGAFIKKEDFYKKNNLPYKRGILLYGSPGNGKTTFIKYLLSNVDALSIIADSKDPSHIVYIKKVVRNDKLNDILKIIVLEDIDGTDYYNRSHFLNMLDGITSTNKTIFIATTNYPHRLDLGLQNRPSRFDSFYEIGDPNTESRKALLKMFFPDINKNALTEAIEKTEGFRGAHFKEIYILSQLEDLDVMSAIEKLKIKFKDFMNFEKVAYIG